MNAAPHAEHEATGQYRVITPKSYGQYVIVSPDGTIHSRYNAATMARYECERLNAEDREARKDDGTR